MAKKQYITEGDMLVDVYASRKNVVGVFLFALAVFTVWLLIGIYTQASTPSTLYFLDIGQGDAELLVIRPSISSDKAIRILIDAGAGSRILSALDDVLGSNSSKYIDIIAVTHPHEDHYGGFIEVVKKYDVGLFVHSGYSVADPAWDVLMDEIDRRSIPMLLLKKGDTLTYGDFHMEVVSPDDTLLAHEDPNEASLVFLAELIQNDERIRMLFTGDAGHIVEEKLIAEKIDISADILKVGHHGSKHSTSANFIHAVRPVISAIGVGENNYGHPEQEILTTLSLGSSHVYATKDYGTIQVPLDMSVRGALPGDASERSGLWSILSGAYRPSRTTLVTLADSLLERPSFSLVAYSTCTFDEPKGAVETPIRINEVAWMGATTGTTHEWIELRREGDGVYPITGWQLINKNGKVHITFDQGSYFDTEFLLLARSAANDALDLDANRTFTGAIRNTNEGLRLFDDECRLVDEVMAAPQWPGGESKTKQTMERVDSNTWGTSGAVGGTPRRVNQATYMPVIQTRRVRSSVCTKDGVDINTADASALTTLVGIGPAYAQKIIDARPFSSLNDLVRVSGIGPASVEKIDAQGRACVTS
ncbi:MAG: helix-hairpin-helix domain-containing protein [bacterium]|nr:helix-hairpin-helix domain-containing protein [bacterium]